MTEPAIDLAFEKLLYRMYTALKPVTSQPWVQLSDIQSDVILGGIPHPISEDTVIPPEGRSPLTHLFHPLQIVKECDIGTIISFSDYPVKWTLPADVDHTHYVMYDDPGTNMLPYFETIVKKIDIAKRTGQRVFVHCHMGISRSTTALSAYYLAFGIPGNPEPNVIEVIKFIQHSRPFAIPNFGFFVQLLKFEHMLRPTKSILSLKL
jgi:protein-tyrosine phosphatase